MFCQILCSDIYIKMSQHKANCFFFLNVKVLVVNFTYNNLGNAVRIAKEIYDELMIRPLHKNVTTQGKS